MSKVNMKEYVEAYVIEHGFLAFGFDRIEIRNGRKVPIGQPQGWNKEINKANFRNYVKDSDHCCAILTGAKSNITVIDFDEASEYPKFIDKFPQFKDAYTVKTRRGYHIYCRYDERVKSIDNCFKDFTKVDTRNDGGLIYAPPTMYKNGKEIVEYKRVENLMRILDFPFDCLSERGIVQITQPVKEVESNTEDIEDAEGFGVLVQENKVSDETMEKVRKCVKAGLLTYMTVKYTDWRNLGFAFNTLGNFELFDEVSKQCKEQYDAEAVKHLWNTTKNNKPNNIGVGSIFYYAKEGNPQLYQDLFGYKAITKEILTLPLKTAEFIKDKISDSLKYSNKTNSWYVFDDETKLWKVYAHGPADFVIRAIFKEIDYAITLEKADEEDSIKTFKKKIDQMATVNMIILHLSKLLEDNDFYLKLDRLEYRLAFTNGVLDLRTKFFCKFIKKEDYLTSTIPFAYKESTTEEIKEIDEIFLKIGNNNEEHKDYYSSALGYSLIGKAELEKSIWYLVGLSGNNGKTTILYVLTEIMPNLCKKVDNKLLSEKTTTKHKYIAKMKGGGRIFYIEENKNGEKLDESLLKQFAEGKKLDNEVMYGTTEDIYLTGKLFVISNNTPVFQADGGMNNRYRQCQFQSQFNRDIKEEDPTKLVFKADPYLSDKLINEKKMALVNYLVNYAFDYCKEKKLKPLPKEWEDEAKETLYCNNKVKMLFDEYIVKGTAEDRFQKDELKAEMKELGISDKELRDFLKNEGYKYNKTARKNNKKGVYFGISKRKTEDVDSTDDEEEN